MYKKKERATTMKMKSSKKKKRKEKFDGKVVTQTEKSQKEHPKN